MSLVEVIYFHKRCPHCGKVLDRIDKMSMSWSQCNNDKCPYFLKQTDMHEPNPWQECFNQR